MLPAVDLDLLSAVVGGKERPGNVLNWDDETWDAVNRWKALPLTGGARQDAAPRQPEAKAPAPAAAKQPNLQGYPIPDVAEPPACRFSVWGVCLWR